MCFFAHTNLITHPKTPFADFVATRFNLSSADIEHIVKYAPSLDKPKTLQNVKRVVKVLTKYGCSQHQIARIMRSHPNILIIHAEKIVEPKLKLLKDLGIEKKDLPKILLKVPTYLATNLQDSILLNIAFLESIFQSQKLLLKAMIINPYILTYSLEKNLRPSLAFWEGCGFQKDEPARFLSSKPILLLSPSLSPPKIDLIRKIGVCRESKMYKHVLSVVVPARVETLESRIDIFRQWGLSDEEIWELFRSNPSIINFSTDTIRKKMEFVVITLGLPPNYVVKRCGFLRYSFEKILKPRFDVFQLIKSLNGVEHLKNKQLHSLIILSEATFVNKILKGHPELETLYALHKNAIAKV